MKRATLGRLQNSLNTGKGLLKLPFTAKEKSALKKKSKNNGNKYANAPLDVIKENDDGANSSEGQSSARQLLGRIEKNPIIVEEYNQHS